MFHSFIYFCVFNNIFHDVLKLILNYFLLFQINDLPRPSYLDKSLSEVGIGTYDCIETAFEDTTIISALDKFLDRRVSALPVVDSEGKLVDIFAKFDVIVSIMLELYCEILSEFIFLIK